MRTVDPEWVGVKKILCLRLDTIGDVLMTTPAFRALKETFTDSQITLMTSSRGAKVGSLVPEVDEMMIYDAPWLKATPQRLNSKMEYKMAEQLRMKHFDAAVIFTVFSQNPLPSALLCYLADIPLRLAHCRENPYQLLTHWVPETDHIDDLRHEVQRQLDLVETIGAITRDTHLSIASPPEQIEDVQALLKRKGLKLDEPWVVIHPGASAPSRRYPPEGFAKAAELLDLAGIQVVFTGDKSEKKLVHSIQGQITADTHNLAGELSLCDLSALLKIAPLLISNNTGPVHVAAAVGTPYRRYLCPHQPPTHAVGSTKPGSFIRCPLPELLQKHLPDGTSQLFAAHQTRNNCSRSSRPPQRS
jgi:lipopolysaccharide heptosyltransferase II